MSEPRTTWGLVRYFLYLGSLGFGGPVALVGAMQRDFVERLGWFAKAGACVVLGRRAIFDLPTAPIGLTAFGLLWRLKVPEPVVIAAAGITGLAIFWMRGAP